MKSKKLLISLTVVALVVVVIVVLAAVLTVQNIEPVYHGIDGNPIRIPSDGWARDELEASYKGKSIVFLSKSNLMSEVNLKNHVWHAFAVVKHFPNVVEIHFVRRTAVAKFMSTSGYVYVDCFGYAMDKPEQDNVMDITSAFEYTDLLQNEVGKPVLFQSSDNGERSDSNARLGYVLGAIEATWQCMVEFSDMTQVLGESSVFGFNEDGDLVITPYMKGKIVVQSPEVDLGARLIKAYSVYYNDQIKLHDDNYTITVYKNGRITTPSK